MEDRYYFPTLLVRKTDIPYSREADSELVWLWSMVASCSHLKSLFSFLSCPTERALLWTVSVTEYHL